MRRRLVKRGLTPAPCTLADMQKAKRRKKTAHAEKKAKARAEKTAKAKKVEDDAVLAYLSKKKAVDDAAVAYLSTVEGRTANFKEIRDKFQIGNARIKELREKAGIAPVRHRISIPRSPPLSSYSHTLSLFFVSSSNREESEEGCA